MVVAMLCSRVAKEGREALPVSIRLLAGEGAANIEGPLPEGRGSGGEKRLYPVLVATSAVFTVWTAAVCNG